jgi:hypothetical protein
MNVLLIAEQSIANKIHSHRSVTISQTLFKQLHRLPILRSQIPLPKPMHPLPQHFTHLLDIPPPTLGAFIPIKSPASLLVFTTLCERGLRT